MDIEQWAKFFTITTNIGIKFLLAPYILNGEWLHDGF